MLFRSQREVIRSQFTEAQIVEIGATLAMVHGLSKVLIVLGLEPEHMETTIIPSPGS